MRPAISVVVPAKNRREDTRACLEAVRASARRARLAAEIVLVDDGSTDGTADMARGLSRRWGGALPLRVVRHPSSHGPAFARNSGARASRAPLIVFTDNDCLPTRDWLGALAAAARKDPRPALLEGPVFRVGGRAGIYDHVVDNRWGGRGLTANLAVTRKAFLKARGFDERFPLPYREDSDFYFKVLELGVPSAFVPRAVVFHPVKKAKPGVFLREARQGIYEALLFLRHPRLYLTRLKWIDGWAFPAYYLGFYAAAAAAIKMSLGIIPANRLTVGASAGLFLASLAVTLHARQRGGRSWTAGTMAAAAAESVVAAYWRLFWVAIGAAWALGILLSGGINRDRNRGLGR